MRRKQLNLFFMFLLIFYFVSFNLNFAQELTIKGKIVDNATSLPLVGANILISSTEQGTTSDSKGNFELTIKTINLTDSLEVTYIGYITIKIQIKSAFNRSIYKMQPKPLELGEIITTYAEREEIANREIVTTVSEISPLQIKQYNSSEISDVFKSVPAVHIEGNDLGGRTIQIWGSNPDEVNVYVDGVLINMLGIKNQADISIIPLDKVSKIDVHKGANLTLLGQGAFGGVVNIKTEDNQNTGLTLKSKIGSYDSKFLIGQLNFSLWNKLILSYSGQYSTMKPEIEYFPGEKFAPKSFNDKIESEKQNHFLGISYFGKTGKISGKIINYNFKYNKPDWEDKNNNYLFSLAFNGNIGHFKNFDIYLNHFYNQEKTKRSINSLSSFTTNFYSNRSNLKLAKKIELTKNNHLQLLTEYFHDELNTNLYAHNAGFNMLLRKTLIYDNRAAIGGTFTFTDQHEKYPFINWNTFIGVREDFIASGEKEFTKSIGGEVNFDRSDYYSSFYFNYGSNVKFPTLLEKSYIENYEIITPSLDTPSQDTLSQKIKPEYINSYQFGIKNEYKNKNGSFNSIDMGLTFFHNTIFNKLLKRPFDTYIIQTQMGRNITKGFEASIRMNELYKYFTISGSYLKTDISNKTLYAFKPEQKVTFQLDLFSMQDFSVSGRYFYEGKSYGWYYDIFDQVQTEEILPFYDFDVAINYRHKFNHLMIEAQLTGSNILDSAEFSYYYLKKRYWQFSLAIGI